MPPALIRGLQRNADDLANNNGGTSSNITSQNMAVSGTTVSESPRATNSTWTNVNGAPTNCN